MKTFIWKRYTDISQYYWSYNCSLLLSKYILLTWTELTLKLTFLLSIYFLKWNKTLKRTYIVEILPMPFTHISPSLSGKSFPVWDKHRDVYTSHKRLSVICADVFSPTAGNPVPVEQGLSLGNGKTQKHETRLQQKGIQGGKLWTGQHSCVAVFYLCLYMGGKQKVLLCIQNHSVPFRNIQPKQLNSSSLNS